MYPLILEREDSEKEGEKVEKKEGEKVVKKEGEKVVKKVEKKEKIVETAREKVKQEVFEHGEVEEKFSKKEDSVLREASKEHDKDWVAVFAYFKSKFPDTLKEKNLVRNRCKTLTRYINIIEMIFYLVYIIYIFYVI